MFSWFQDCYIFPLDSVSPVPFFLLPLSGPGLPELRGDTLLCLIIRTKRKRPGDHLVQALPPTKLIKPSHYEPPIATPTSDVPPSYSDSPSTSIKPAHTPIHQDKEHLSRMFQDEGEGGGINGNEYLTQI